MDVDQMAVRCPDAEIVGVATLSGHQFRINTHGVATVIPAKGSAVHGVLWEISKADEARLDRYEGVASGFYRKLVAQVRIREGTDVDALIYRASDEHPGRARQGYLERVLAAAQHHQLPTHHVAALRAPAESCERIPC